MLTNTFYIHLAQTMKNEPEQVGSFFIAVGSGDPGWDQGLPVYERTRNNLVNEIGRKVIEYDDIQFLDTAGMVTTTPSARIQFSTLFSADEGIATWRECGLFVGGSADEANSGNLLAYYIYPQIEKTQSMELTRTISLDLTPGASGPGQVVTRYLGNSNSEEFHDLENLKSQCQVDEIRIDRKIYFGSTEQALALGYDYCAYCFSRELSQR